MKRPYIILLFFLISGTWNAQLFVARDSITVLENGYALKMPWANGINFSNISNMDLNLDGKKDLVAFDKINQFGIGRFRCFINTGIIVSGQTTYSANPDLSNYFPVVSNWALCRDYNCDGKEDLFCSTSGGMMIYANASHTNITGPPTVSFTLVKSLLYSIYPGPQSANLYVSPIALPGIADIDNDGDLDILTFNAGGYTIEYHENIRTGCDSLEFRLNTSCWGKIIETNCSVDLNQNCSPKLFPGNNMTINDNRHAGSGLTCFDSDGDGDQDLILGDIGCPDNNILYAHNGGSPSAAIITASSGVYPNYQNPGNTTQIKFNNFPCAYYVDVDGDEKKDLVASPNAPGSENYQSMWYYKNTSSTGTVNFQFVKNNLLQDEMIEVGQNSFPVLLDYDADGLKDLLIGTYGYYLGNSLHARLTLYKNTGTSAQPSYSLITRDYAGMGTFSLNTIVPTVGDIDADGDTDIILGNQSGQMYWLKNTAGPGAVCSFSFLPTALFTTPSAAAAPQLFDMNNDGKLDLMIGGKNGKIMYYKNTGSVTAPSFTPVNSFFGNVNVQGSLNLYGLDGYSAPFFFKEDGTTKLLVGSISGQIFYYSVPSETSACILINSNANGINEGGQSTPFFEDINNDGKRDLFVGNGSGGLSFFSSMGPDVGATELINDRDVMVNVYPNPAQQTLHIRITKSEVKKGFVTVSDILGKEVFFKIIHSNSEQLNIDEWQAGIYFIKIEISDRHQTFFVTKKIIKE